MVGLVGRGSDPEACAAGLFTNGQQVFLLICVVSSTVIYDNFKTQPPIRENKYFISEISVAGKIFSFSPNKWACKGPKQLLY